MDKYPSFFVQRVLEYGNWNDWKLLLSYYGKDQIVEICKRLRTLDSISLSYICAISNTKKEEYRCYRLKQSSSCSDMQNVIISKVRELQ